MCFSAEASFVGAAVITTAGVASLALITNKREIPFAALGLLFGAHQALEGWTWLELDGSNDAVLSGFGVHFWVMFAWALLPIYVPISVWLIEKDPRKRRWMTGLIGIGGVLAAFMAVQALQPEIEVSVVDGNLNYHLGLPFSAVFLAVPYVLATCVTPMLSSFRWVRIFGAGNFVAMSLAAFIQAKDYSSIWCTLAAFLSLMILAHYVDQRRQRRQAAGSVSGDVAVA
jgi:hypothetical protein